MVNPVTFSGMATFGSAATKVQPSTPTPYVNGFQAADIVPCEWLNWFLANLTGDDNLGGTALNHVITELDNLVTGSGATVAPGDDTQVIKAIRYLREEPIILTTGSSPYTLVGFSAACLLIAATTNPYIVNLPQAAGCVGYRVRIVNGSLASSGLIRIHPFTGDAIGTAGANVDCYLQNMDQSNAPFLFQSLNLVATESGYWAVTGGQYCPAQSVDTNGSQYHLGKLHHLPLGNTTSRQLGTYTGGGGWYGSPTAIQATGALGVPTGAKAVRVKLDGGLTITSTGTGIALINLSDNASNTPGQTTAHPGLQIRGYQTTGNNIETTTEVDVPLNSSGQFYIYSGVTNCSLNIAITIVGYYMGD